MSISDPILAINGLSKIFPGVKALDNVDFFLRKGEIHALMGENGAGKSVLVKVLTGVYKRDKGKIYFEGKPFYVHSPKEAQECGISTVYQEINLVPNLSVAENIYLNRQPQKRGFIDWKETNKKAKKVLERLDLKLDVKQPLGSFSIAIQQMVAIGRALDLDAKVLILDEPTSSLNVKEVQQLFTIMRKLKHLGHSIIFITHFIDQVYEISDRITVLRNGALVGEFMTDSIDRVELIAKLMGKKLAEFSSEQFELEQSDKDKKGIPFLEAKGLGKKGIIEPFDLHMHKREVLGLAGLLGSGRTEIANLIFGIDKADKGQIKLNGKPVNISNPHDSLKFGFGLCPEDRKSEGIIEDLSIRENIILSLQVKKGCFKYLKRKMQEKLVTEYIDMLQIKTPDMEQAIKNLSGGNQQKVIVARWLASNPGLLIMDEPTRGIDVGAKAEIQKLILELSQKGMAILFISSELEEVIRCSQKVVVVRDKVKIAELTGTQINEHTIMKKIAVV
jgi:monosaccharide-transporting ATPase